ncbi:MAG: iron ABC transporter permease [Actinomycetota bacterium]|nr:iron ABC transporter permease [Actinomycetota bacterium]
MSKKKIVILVLVPFVLLLISLALGRYTIPPVTVCKAFLAKVFPIAHTWSDQVDNVLFQVRLPRAILALLIGGGLSICGASFQGIFKNPLVSPDILGVSAAAGFGAAMAIWLAGTSVNTLSVQASAFVFGILAVFMAYNISRVYKTTPTVILVLSGVIVGALFSAFTSAIKLVADPLNKLPAITFWLMGSLATASWNKVLTASIPILIGVIGLLSVRWRINLLSLGDDEARALGVRTEFMKRFVIACATLITAASVCVSGVIGWVGLVMPHVSRMLFGPDHKVLLPVSIATGASFLLIVDVVARCATAIEIPLGILTTVVGVPFFAYLLRRTKGGWK